MVGFNFFVKSMTSCSSKLKVLPIFCFPNTIPDDVTTSSMYVDESLSLGIHTSAPSSGIIPHNATILDPDETL